MPRFLYISALTLALLTLVTVAPTFALAQMQMNGHAHDSAMPAPSGAAGTTGRVNAVDAGKHTINLTHGPIPALGWPAMTMDFGTAPSVDLSGIKPGDTVAFTVSMTPDGIYRIDTLKPTK
jgi:Cu/Ag efflux protein CusF